jgi:hypothetical protein
MRPIDLDNPVRYATYLNPSLRASTAAMLASSERIEQSLYDFQELPSQGGTNFIFFQQPAGQNGRTLADTNLTSAGSLPQGQAFLITGIEVPIFSGAATDATAGAGQLEDLNAYYKAGFLTLTIGTKPYTQDAPLGAFPPSFGVLGQTAISTTVADTTVIHETARIAGAPFTLRTAPLLLTSSVNFNVQIGFTLPLTMPSGNIGRFGVKLKGQLYRLAQ